MKISVLSGKGGTGKTLVSVNLARVGGETLYIDCDVEEPNGSVFLHPKVKSVTDVQVTIPEPIKDKCQGCMECVRFCKYNALAYANELLVFPELCHDCGGCIRLCRFGALGEKKRSIGRVESGQAGEVETRCGILNSGEITGVPIIKTLLRDLPSDRLIVVDCPPGSGCSVMESVKDSDFCLLVAEPTPFGLHNLQMVYELLQLLAVPCGVLINKAVPGADLVERFSMENRIPILGEIPFAREVAFLSSQGKLLVDEKEEYRRLFAGLLKALTEVAHGETAGNTER